MYRTKTGFVKLALQLIRFVIAQIGGSLRVLRLPPPVKTDRRDIVESGIDEPQIEQNKFKIFFY